MLPSLLGSHYLGIKLSIGQFTLIPVGSHQHTDSSVTGVIDQIDEVFG